MSIEDQKDGPVTNQRMWGGFWRRAWALFIDSFILGLPTMIIARVYASNISVVIWTLALGNVMFLLYKIHFEALSGQTLGKRIAGIRIERATGGHIGYARSTLRNLYEIYCFGNGLAKIVALRAVSASDYESADFDTQYQLLQNAAPSWQASYLILFAAITVLEIIVMLGTEKKQAIHDLLAGTVVVRVAQRSTAQTSPSSSQTDQNKAVDGKASVATN